MRRALTALGLVLPLIGGPAMAQRRDSANAAAWYNRAYERFVGVTVSNEEWKAVWAFENDAARGPSDQVREIVNRFDPAITLALRGSRLHAADFHTDFAAGPFATQDHFSKTAMLVKLVRDDFLIRLYDGENEVAIDRLAGLYRMAQHCGTQRTIMSSLVGSAMLSFAEAQTETALENGGIGPLEAGDLLRAMALIDQDDPFNYAKAVAHEREITTKWMLDRYAVEGGAAKLGDDREHFKLPKSLEQFAGGTQLELDAAVKSADKLMARLGEIFALKDADKARGELVEIDRQINAGDFGPLAREMLGGIVRSYTARIRSQDDLHVRLQQLNAIADGTLDPKTFANAAAWYMRAVRALGKFAPEQKTLIRQYAHDHGHSADEVMSDILTSASAQWIINTVRNATTIKRCDFRAVRSDWPAALMAYQGGMRDVARLLHADAARLVHAGDMEGAADRLAVCLRMIAQFGRDPTVGSALTAHAAFQNEQAMIADAVDAHMFNDEQINKLKMEIEAFSKTEPFAYHPAVAQLREGLQQWVISKYEGQADDDVKSRARQFIGRCDSNALLWLAVIRDRMTDDSQSAGRQYASDVAPLDDVISLEAFAATAGQLGEVRRLIEHGEYDGIIAPAQAPIAPLVQRMTDASDDLRTCQGRLEPPKLKATMTGRPARDDR